MIMNLNIRAVTIRLQTANMTDKQILTATKPKILYYKNTEVIDCGRICLFCEERVNGKFVDLEKHVLIVDLKRHHV